MLGKLFGCHCRADRSFTINQKQFPLCARCTGELIGILIGAAVFYFINFSSLVLVILLIPLCIDGFLQALTKYESSNFKRSITGFLFGFGIIQLFIKSAIFTVQLGYNYKMYGG